MTRGRRLSGNRLRLALLPLLIAAAGAAQAHVVDITNGAWWGTETAWQPGNGPDYFKATTAGFVTMRLRETHAGAPQWGPTSSSGWSAWIDLPQRTLQLPGGATTMFHISANQVFSSTIFGPSGTGYGTYWLECLFTPEDQVSTVPLPPTLWLMIAGIALLLTRLRRAASSFRPVTH